MKIILQILIWILKVPLKIIKFIAKAIDFAFELLGFLIAISAVVLFSLVIIYPNLSQSEKEKVNKVLEKLYYDLVYVKEKGNEIVNSVVTKIEDIALYIRNYINSRDIAQKDSHSGSHSNRWKTEKR